MAWWLRRAARCCSELAFGGLLCQILDTTFQRRRRAKAQHLLCLAEQNKAQERTKSTVEGGNVTGCFRD